MQLDTVASWATIMSAIIPLCGGIYLLWRAYNHTERETQEQILSLKHQLERIELQFGPNGGGIREAVNNIDRRVRNIDEKVQALHVEHAKLAGKFSMMED